MNLENRVNGLSGGQVPQWKKGIIGDGSDDWSVLDKSMLGERFAGSIVGGSIAAGVFAGSIVGAASTVASPNLASLGLVGMGAVAAAIGFIGCAGMLAASKAFFSAPERHSSLTQSGVERTVDVGAGEWGRRDRTTTFKLPNGLVIRDKGELEAADAEGKSLKAERFRDPESGSDRIRVTSESKIIELDPVTLDFSIASPTFNSYGVLDGDRRDVRDQKQLVRADGSMEFIVDENSRYRKELVESPIHNGEFTERIVPHNHSYLRVEVSPDGDTSAQRVVENFSDDGKPQTFRDALRDAVSKPVHTSLDVSSGRFQILEENRWLHSATSALKRVASSMTGVPLWLEEGSRDRQGVVADVFPFVSREEMAEARAQRIEERTDVVRRRVSSEDRFEVRSGDGTVIGRLGDKVLRFVDSDGEQVATARLRDGAGSSPLLAGGRTFVADERDRLVAFNAGTGSRLWERDLAHGLLGEPAFDKDGNVRVHVAKGERVIQQTYSPEGELLSSRLMDRSVDLEKMKTPRQVELHKQRAEREAREAAERLAAEQADQARRERAAEATGDMALMLEDMDRAMRAEGGKGIL
ncbi:MAG: PQQ-binding-like beta-propeller repeat protein [Armatimonadetes bacterium]|nr:PQQ-binding-like beta-propeller repeat protein [Armatimonadota bacterium]